MGEIRTGLEDKHKKHCFEIYSDSPCGLKRWSQVLLNGVGTALL